VLRTRLLTLLAAAGVGGAFLAGLLIHGYAGGLILLAVAVVLMGLSSLAWEALPARGRRLRVLVVGLVLAIGAVKLATGH
jgi:hypothetical protein